MSSNKIAADVLRQYDACGLYSKIYARLRWRYCPFEQMEALVPKEGIILDLGCGEGLFSAYLAASSSRRTVIGIDSDSKRIKQATRAGHAYSNLSFQNSNALHFDPVSNLAGAVFTDFLHHMSFDQQLEILGPIVKKINKQGCLLIKEVGKDGLAIHLWSRLLDFVLYPSDKIFYRSSNDWLKLLEQFNLRSQKLDTHVRTFIPNKLYIGIKETA